MNDQNQGRNKTKTPGGKNQLQNKCDRKRDQNTGNGGSGENKS